MVDKLVADGVEVWVCGQTVSRGGNPLSDVLPGIPIAQSAMTFNINRLADGWTAIGVY
jgi:intracellular sulfur oxidation DsrE/DsrF family protein